MTSEADCSLLSSAHRVDPLLCVSANGTPLSGRAALKKEAPGWQSHTRVLTLLQRKGVLHELGCEGGREVGPSPGRAENGGQNALHSDAAHSDVLVHQHLA